MRSILFALAVGVFAASGDFARAQDKKADLEPLIERLKSSDPKERTKAMEALAKLGTAAKPAARKLSEMAILDFEPKLRQQAHETLKKVHPDLAPLVLKLSTDKEGDSTAEVAGKIGKLGADGEGASPVLIWTVNNLHRDKKKPEAIAACLLALGEVVPADDTIVHQIGQSAALPGSEDIAKAGATALRKIGKARPETRKFVVKYLGIALNTKWEGPRLEILLAAKEFGPDARPLTRALKAIAGLKDEKDEIRQAAIEALAEIEKKAK